MEPNAKRFKLDDDVFVLNKLKGRIVLRIERFSKFIKGKRECYSESVRIRGFDWALLPNIIGCSNPSIIFDIDCDGESRGPNWKCVASVILLCTSGSEEVEIGRKDDIKFDATTTDSGFICEVSN